MASIRGATREIGISQVNLKKKNEMRKGRAVLKDTNDVGETNVTLVLQKDVCVQRLHHFVINNSDFLFTLLLAAAWMW